MTICKVAVSGYMAYESGFRHQIEKKCALCEIARLTSRREISRSHDNRCHDDGILTSR
ncbi:hypothetical protein ERO13_D04G039900v2 [Gossypium hirsutum]|uniref:Uncharacterized protein n=2 Tax=Gossypium TaxID=3633 RepID=A0A5D2L9T5_GOSTO|nr:hypothetical protein ERO13_D04G039900v2 [Gossypium hirsutum]TYG72771.1 hypothetical protein ES288_D04G047700v1 [Gossypium darwinii]TYH75864.1 hypothetical protein ES332_D04G047600v1 [Gossypium tomentosum]